MTDVIHELIYSSVRRRIVNRQLFYLKRDLARRASFEADLTSLKTNTRTNRGRYNNVTGLEGIKLPYTNFVGPISHEQARIRDLVVRY